MIKDTFRAALGRPSYHGEERSIAERWDPALCPTSHTWAQVVARWLDRFVNKEALCRGGAQPNKPGHGANNCS